MTGVVLCAFEMRGDVPLDLRGAEINYDYAAANANADTTAARAGAVSGANEPLGNGVLGDGACANGVAALPAGVGRLSQGTLFTGSNPVDARDAERDGDRTLLTGWVAQPEPSGADAVAVATLQQMLDRGGPGAVCRLRGDFVLAHLSEDGRALRLFRGLTSMVPLFWRATGDALRWSTNPIDLLDGAQARLSDVALDLLPMVIAERGFPHDRSWFRGVDRLPAGSCVTLRSGARPVVERFDDLSPAPAAPSSLAEAADGLRARLRQACRRAVSPGDAVVLMLSGGIDSAAVARELGDATPHAAGMHFTLNAFPGFAEDRAAAESVADACGLSFVPYDMGRHVTRGGDYADEQSGANLPQTHVPLQGSAATAREAQARGARFVFAGILADQIFAHDLHRGLVDVAGWSILNPLVTGEPPWQLVRRTVGGSFEGCASPGVRGYARYLRGVLRGDPTVALPNRDVIVHPVGFSETAAAQVTTGLRIAADRARQQLISASEHDGRRRGIPPGTTSRFQVNETFNTPNVQSAILNHFLPRQTFVFTPYADRDVIEYALALPNAFRIGLAHGATIDKLVLRTAYAEGTMPPQIGRRMQQARIDAVSAVYVNQNFERCRALLAEDSRLREAGVLSDAFVRGLSRQSVHRNGEEIARLCVIEQWLRRIAS